MTIPVEFAHSRERVFEALCDLRMYPLWNSGMKQVSEPGPLSQGLRFKTESLVAGGRINLAEVEVTQLVPSERIELVSHSGVVAYRAVFELKTKAPEITEVICSLRFEFNNFVLDLARPVIEAMAAARIRGDLEALRAMLGK